MAVSVSQTSFTPGLKLHAPAASEGTIRAKVGGKVDSAPSGQSCCTRVCPAIGTQRTSACALHMSAFDPKRTPASFSFLKAVRLGAPKGNLFRAALT
jgi:hypothetical protein